MAENIVDRDAVVVVARHDKVLGEELRDWGLPLHVWVVGVVVN